MAKQNRFKSLWIHTSLLLGLRREISQFILSSRLNVCKTLILDTPQTATSVSECARVSHVLPQPSVRDCMCEWVNVSGSARRRKRSESQRSVV